MEVASEESSLQHQRPETSHGNNHPVDNNPEVHLPMIMIQEFQRLATTLHIDYYDFQELLGLTSEGSQDITESNFSYFISEIVRKIERLQSQPQGGGGDDDNYDENEIHRKKKKKEIKKHENRLITKITTLNEDIQYNITLMNQQNSINNNNNNKISTKTNHKNNQTKLLNNLYKEKQQKLILEEFIESQNKKIKVLVGHVEKLVKALKIENNKKIKISEEYHILRKEESFLKEKIDKQYHIQSIQNRVIEELKAGSKVLEDQLKLMDEKFLEIRSKLDVSRNYFIEKMKKIQKECTDLRGKYSIATGGGLLDHIRIDKKKYSNQDLTVTIQSEPALFATHTMTPFNEHRGSSPQTVSKSNGPPSPTEDTRKGSVQLNGGDRRSSASSPVNGRLDSTRKSSSFQEIKNLPKPRPSSAVDYNNHSPDPVMRRQNTGYRPKSAMASTLPSHPSLASLSRTSKEKQASLIIRRIRSRASGGKENWTADRIFELLEG